MMVGRELAARRARRSAPPADDIVLAVENLTDAQAARHLV